MARSDADLTLFLKLPQEMQLLIIQFVRGCKSPRENPHLFFVCRKSVEARIDGNYLFTSFLVHIKGMTEGVAQDKLRKVQRALKMEDLAAQGNVMVLLPDDADRRCVALYQEFLLQRQPSAPPPLGLRTVSRDDVRHLIFSRFAPSTRRSYSSVLTVLLKHDWLRYAPVRISSGSALCVPAARSLYLALRRNRKFRAHRAVLKLVLQA
jgi:hypothetical protein